MQIAVLRFNYVSLLHVLCRQVIKILALLTQCDKGYYIYINLFYCNVAKCRPCFKFRCHSTSVRYTRNENTNDSNYAPTTESSHIFNPYRMQIRVPTTCAGCGSWGCDWWWRTNNKRLKEMFYFNLRFSIQNIRGEGEVIYFYLHQYDHYGRHFCVTVCLIETSYKSFIFYEYKQRDEEN